MARERVDGGGGRRERTRPGRGGRESQRERGFESIGNSLIVMRI